MTRKDFYNSHFRVVLDVKKLCSLVFDVILKSKSIEFIIKSHAKGGHFKLDSIKMVATPREPKNTITQIFIFPIFCFFPIVLYKTIQQIIQDI